MGAEAQQVAWDAEEAALQDAKELAATEASPREDFREAAEEEVPREVLVNSHGAASQYYGELLTGEYHRSQRDMSTLAVDGRIEGPIKYANTLRAAESRENWKCTLLFLLLLP